MAFTVFFPMVIVIAYQKTREEENSLLFEDPVSLIEEL